MVLLWGCGQPPQPLDNVPAELPQPGSAQPRSILPPPLPPTPKAPIPKCFSAFTPDNANEIYQKLGAIEAKDDCEFEAVKARGSSIELQWKLPDESIIRWSLDPVACDPKDPTVTDGLLALTADKAAQDACPAKWKASVKKLGGLTKPLVTKHP